MKCTKCNRVLPDDSRFCQYCGFGIVKTVVPPIEIELEPIEKVGIAVSTDVIIAKSPTTEVPEQMQSVRETPNVATIIESSEFAAPQLPKLGNMTYDEALSAILQIQTHNINEALEANSQSQPDNESDEDFGLVPEKPIFTLALRSVEGEEEYLSRLFTQDGEKIKYIRRGSTSVDGINGMIDIYDTYLPSDQFYKTIFINMYGAKCSFRAPAGFSFDGTSNVICTKCNRTLPTDSEYCQFCGNCITIRPGVPKVMTPVASTSRTILEDENIESKSCQNTLNSTSSQMKIQEKQKIVTTTLIIIAVISIVGNLIQFFCDNQRANSVQDQLDIAISNNADLQSKYDADIADAIKENQQLSSLCERRADIIDDLKTDNTRLSELVRVYEKNTVLICQNNQTVFHTPDCTIIDPSLCETLSSASSFGRNLRPCSSCYGDYDIYVLDDRLVYHNLSCSNLPSLEHRTYLTHTVAYHQDYFAKYGYTECPFCW